MGKIMSSRWDIELLDLDLEVFQGPFDLLLALILREEVNIFEVQLAEIVIAYLERLEEEAELNLEAVSEFLILISALMEIKSAQLLPRPEALELEDLTPEEARDELVLRLVTYKKFKEAAAWMRSRYDGTRHWHFRSAPLPQLKHRPEAEVPRRHDPVKLAAAVRALLAEPPRIDIDHMMMATASVWEQMKAIRGMLRRQSQVAFDEIVGGADRITQAVAFFALLEMYNSGELNVEQEHLFGQILIYEARRDKKIA